MIDPQPPKSLKYLTEILHGWKQTYPHNRQGVLLFQNKRLNSNVLFTDEAFHRIQNHSRGFDLIPQAIEKPDEVWSQWGDDKQRATLRNYLLFGKICYVVQTKDGSITDAFTCTPRQANKYRRGAII